MSGHRMGQGVVFGAAIALLVSAGQDPAAAAESRETVVDLKTCKVNKRRDVWTCPGLDKYGVYYGDDDLRAFLSVGPNAAKRKATEQTLGPFNTIFKGKSQRATIEWRVTGDGKNVTPHATIVRYYTKNDEGSGEVFVVMKVTAKETCQAAIIEALNDAKAIDFAREVADGEAQKFDCKGEPVEHRRGGKSPF